MGLATEHLFSSNSDLNNRLTGGVTFELVTPPAEEPLTVDEAKESLRIKNTRQDALINRIIPRARQWIEMATGQMFIEQTWRQIHNIPGSALSPRTEASDIITLHLERARSIVSVKVWPNMDATSPTTVAATTYFLTGQSLVPRTSWPSTRGIGGLEVEYKVGHGSDKDDFQTNGRARPLQQALDMVIAYLFENPGDNVTFESKGGSTQVRGLPPEAQAFLETYVRYEL